MSEPPTSSSSVKLTLPAKVGSMLARLSRKDLRLRLARFPLLAAILLPLFWTFEALLDLVFNLSWSARIGFQVASLLIVGWLCFRHVIQPLRRRLNRRAAALLVERKFPEFRTSLISAVDFTAARDGLTARSAPLVQILLGQVQRLVDRTDILRGIVDTRPVWRLFLGVLAVGAFVGGLLWFFQPQSLLLARRVFLSADAMPSRTTVEAVTKDFTLNAGTDAELAARARGVVPRNGRVKIVYADGHGETVPVSVSATEPGVFRISLRNVLQSFRYHFEINDGTGPEFSVKTRVLPALTRTKFVYIPPAYTGRPQTELPAGSLSLLAGSHLIIEGEANQPLQSATLELKGLNQTQPMDNGDAIHNARRRQEALEARLPDLQAKLDKMKPGIETATTDRDTAQKALSEADKARQAAASADERRSLNHKWEQAAQALKEAQGALDTAGNLLKRTESEQKDLRRQIEDAKKQIAQAQAAPAPDKDVVTRQKRTVRADIEIPKDGLNGLSIHLVDEDGIGSENDPVYRLTITADKPPVSEILEPKGDRKTVEANDKVTIKFRARDDYRLEKVALKYVVLRPNAEGEAATAEQGEIPVPFPPGSTSVTQDYVWDLANFVPKLVEGCSVSFWLEARDHFTLYSNDAPSSRKMTLAVVSAEEKKKELLTEMEKAAKEIERLSERQRKANEKNDANIRQ